MPSSTNKKKVIPRYVQRRLTQSLLYLLMFSVLLLGVLALYRGGIELAQLEARQLNIRELPGALFLSFLRMTLSYLASLVFAYGIGVVAARTLWGERILVPALDILQSVPVVGFFPAAISFFIAITNEHRLGIELAACFLIFTSQAWNIAFAVYEAIKGVPSENRDAVISFGVSGSQRFLKLYLPVSIPRVVYNSILSWSNGWFFLVACEIIAVGPVRYDLPGIGSFLSKAAEQDKINLVFIGLFALTSLILTMDILVWRPLSRWAERFKQELSPVETSSQSLLFPNLRRKIGERFRFLRPSLKRVFIVFSYPLRWTFRNMILPLMWDLPGALFSYAKVKRVSARRRIPEAIQEKRAKRIQFLGWVVLFICMVLAFIPIVKWLLPPWPSIVSEIPVCILASTGRLIIALGLSLAWVLPVVLWSWDRPRARQWLTTIAQVGASLPATALFPLIIILIVRKFGGGMEMASILLLLSGMQWYVLFNCLGGTHTIPSDIIEITRSLGMSRMQTWRKLVMPAIRPSLITGAITAWGGGWNALVVAEYIGYKNRILSVKGIGSLLNYSVYQLGDGRAILLCIASIVTWILFINILFWRSIYKFAMERYRFEL